MAEYFILGTAAATGLGLLFSKNSAGKDVETCVHAYYADKYNGIQQGDPNKTFVRCMASKFSPTFTLARNQYKEPSTQQSSG